MSTTFVEVAKKLELGGYTRCDKHIMLTPEEQKNVNCLAMVMDCLIMQEQQRDYLRNNVDLDVQPLADGGYTVTIKL